MNNVKNIGIVPSLVGDRYVDNIEFYKTIGGFGMGPLCQQDFKSCIYNKVIKAQIVLQ